MVSLLKFWKEIGELLLWAHGCAWEERITGGCWSRMGALIPDDRCIGRLWKVVVTDRGRKFWVAHGIVCVSKFLFEPLYRGGAIELVHEYSLNFGGSP